MPRSINLTYVRVQHEKVKVEQALGMVLCHDITRIVPGEFKGRAFKKVML